MNFTMDFESNIADLETKIAELRSKSGSGVNIDAELTKLQGKVDAQMAELYAKLTPWQKTLVARHPKRPHFQDYVAKLITDFVPLAGDRNFGEDRAITGGMGRFRGRPVVILGHEKGHDTTSRLRHNFGMAMPEGYRKAIRLMELANRFKLPVITLVDTPGAFPGVQAEERGQAEAIARSTQACLNLEVPMISVIVGEGGSGGAVALAAGNRVLMFEHAVYAVISPEGCASILWRTAERATDAANAMKMTAQDLLKLGVIDRIIPEPLGGAHRKPELAIAGLGQAIDQELTQLISSSAADFKQPNFKQPNFKQPNFKQPNFKQHRRERFLGIGKLAA
jgi:acetyl-CoA carboxylase carboxyl transferase subunit alpha